MDQPDGPFLQRMTKVLDLTDAQQASIKKIQVTERGKTATLREQRRANREALRRAEEAQPFDENAVRTLAEQRGALETELTVARAWTRNQIDAILTPEQRELAAKLRPEPGEGRKERHRGR
jgi:protein CpxP